MYSEFPILGTIPVKLDFHHDQFLLDSQGQTIAETGGGAVPSVHFAHTPHD